MNDDIILFSKVNLNFTSDKTEDDISKEEYLKIRNKQLEYALDQAEEEIFRWQQRCFQIEVEHEELKKQIMGILK